MRRQAFELSDELLAAPVFIKGLKSISFPVFGVIREFPGRDRFELDCVVSQSKPLRILARSIAGPGFDTPGL